jgi:predicted RNA-binding protein YlqC (UPF0109 family)
VSPADPTVSRASADEALALVRTMVRALVNREDEVVVIECGYTGRHLLVRVEVAQDDMGLALGQRGSHINTVRQIATAFCRKRGLKIDIDLFAKEAAQGG